jgi:hypothetical protein
VGAEKIAQHREGALAGEGGREIGGKRVGGDEAHEKREAFGGVGVGADAALAGRRAAQEREERGVRVLGPRT